MRQGAALGHGAALHPRCNGPLPSETPANSEEFFCKRVWVGRDSPRGLANGLEPIR
jgi:hypothetical protein